MAKPVLPLRQRVIEDVSFRDMSPATQKVYTYAVGSTATTPDGPTAPLVD